MALAKQAFVQGLRKMMRYVDRLAGALLIVAGAYLVYFWVKNIQQPGDSSGPIGLVENLSSRLSNDASQWGPWKILLVLGALVGAGVAVVVTRRSRRQTHPITAAKSDTSRY